jgi:hypothetical protein
MAKFSPPSTSFGSVSYTPKEVAIYKFIAAKKNCFALSNEVIAMIYGKKRPPKNARIIVGGMLNTLKWKLDHNRDQLILKKSRRRGPHPMVWLLRPRVPSDSTIDRVVARFGVAPLMAGLDRATAPAGASNSPAA